MNQDTPQTHDNFNEIKRILYRCLKYWYIFLISISVALVIAYLINRYTPRVYPVSTSILIKSKKEVGSSTAEILYGNQLFDNVKDLNNETIMLKSYPLIKEVINQLNFDQVFYKEGNIKNSEIYINKPAYFSFDSTSRVPYGKAFVFKIIDDKTFLLYDFVSDDKPQPIKNKYFFNQWSEINGLKFRAVKNNSYDFYYNKDSEYVLRLINPNALINKYRAGLGVRLVKEHSSILALSVKGTIPAKEMDFLNKLTEVYISRGLEDKNRNATKTISFIDDQLQSITDSLKAIESSIEQFKTDNTIESISGRASRLIGQLENYEKKKAEIIIQKRYFEYLIGYLSNDNLDSEIIAPSSLGVSDPILNTLIQQLVELQLEKKRLIESSENPYIPAFNNRVQTLKANIIENINNLSNQTDILLEDIESRTEKLTSEIALLPDTERRFINITRMYNLSEDLYLFLVQKRAEAAISKASSTSDVSVVNPPRAGSAIQPQEDRNYLAAFFLGLTIPLAFFTFKEYTSNKVRYKEDLDSLTNIPFLGMVGHEEGENNLVVNDKPKSGVAESFRTIRSNIQFFTAKKDKRVLLVTSSISGEGKTFCSINLAAVFSFSGKKTILVGADLRKPKIFLDFNIHNDIGLSNYLAHSVELDQIIQPTNLPNLDIISGGSIPPNPSELLMSDKLEIMVKTLKKKYDYIIFDTPPIGVVTDGYILMNHTDHNIYIVRQNFTPKNTIKAADEMHRTGKLRNMSILYNDIKVVKYGYSYGYGYGYGYGSGNGYGYYEDNKNQKKWYKIFSS